jgi:hypothetical protein
MSANDPKRTCGASTPQLGSSEFNAVFKRLKSAKHVTGKEHQIAQHQHREAGVEMRNRERNPVNKCSENCEHEGNQECHLGRRCEWPIKHSVLPRTRDRAENDFSLYLTELHSAAGGREETVEHLLKAVKLALLDIPTGAKPISEDHRSRTLSRHLATCHQRGVRTDLPYPYSLGYARIGLAKALRAPLRM